MDINNLKGLMEAYSEVYAPEQIDEAEGSYGQTPKARQSMGKLAIARRSKPASEYSQKGEKTKKVKSIEKHTQRIDDGPDVGNRGKKSTKPRWSGYLGAKGRGEMDQDSRDYARDSAVEYTAGGNKPGPGTVTKNPKKLRKQKAMGEFAKEDFDIFDVVLEFLQTEGYAETLEEAEWMMANLIDEEAVAIILGEEQLDELSNRTVSNALNARIAATGAASDRAYKHRNPQAMRAAETAADKEARMKGAVARRRARMNKEDFESWLDEAMSNYEKNRKRAAQRAAARNAARDQGKTGAVPGVGYVTPRRERETWTDESGKTRHAKGL
jgi:hypothetical protein